MDELHRATTRAAARNINKERYKQLKAKKSLTNKEFDELIKLRPDGKKYTKEEWDKMEQPSSLCSYRPKTAGYPRVRKMASDGPARKMAPEGPANFRAPQGPASFRAPEGPASIRAPEGPSHKPPMAEDDSDDDDDNRRPKQPAKRISWADVCSGATASTDADAPTLPSKTRWVDNAEWKEAQEPPSKYGKFDNINSNMRLLIEAALERQFVIPVLKNINDMLRPSSGVKIPQDPNKVMPIADHFGPSTTTAGAGGSSTLHRSDDFDDEMDDAAVPSRQEILDMWDSVEANRQANPLLDMFDDSANDDEPDMNAGHRGGGGLFGSRKFGRFGSSTSEAIPAATARGNASTFYGGGLFGAGEPRGTAPNPNARRFFGGGLFAPGGTHGS